MPNAPDLDFRHVAPPFRTFCGPKALSSIPRELSRVGAKRAAIICVAPVLDHPTAVPNIKDALGDTFVGLFDEVAEHSPLPSVLKARDFLAEVDADAIFAVGGGSAVVTARAAGILLAEGKDIRDLCTRRESDGTLVSPKLNQPKLPQWVIPSTPTSAYAKAGAAVRDPATGERLALYDPKMRAQGIFLDPDTARTAPPNLAWSASLNVLAMAVEGLQSSKVDPMADAMLSGALRSVVQWAPRLDMNPEDLQPRLQLMLAALMSGQGSDHTGGGLAQALAHAVGPRASVPNGVIEAILLPHVLKFNIEAVRHRVPELAAALGLSRSAGNVVETLDDELRRLGVPQRLRDSGVAEAALADATDHAMNDWSITTGPREVGRSDVWELLSAAW